MNHDLEDIAAALVADGDREAKVHLDAINGLPEPKPWQTSVGFGGSPNRHRWRDD